MVLGKVFIQVPDKIQAWQDLLRLSQDETFSVRSKAAWSLGKVFIHVPDKTQAWQDIHKLTLDENSDMRRGAVRALGMAFSQVPDKTQAWQDLHKLTQDENSYVRSGTAYPLGAVFSQVPDKAQAWQDLHRLMQDEDNNVRSSAAEALRIAFGQVPDKIQAWQDLHRLLQDGDSEVQWRATSALGVVFSQIRDKTQAWQDLHRLAQNNDSYVVRIYAAQALGEAFSQVPDKAQAWQDLHKLTLDMDSNVRSRAIAALGEAFSQVPDKVQAWQDLHRLTQDDDHLVRSNAADALGRVFNQVPDKDQAWQDLHRLTLDEDVNVRWRTAQTLGSIFGQVPDKDLAWRDFHKLTQDENSIVRGKSAEALGGAFSQVPDKAQAWQDLRRLTQDENSYVRQSSAEALGEAFSQAPDKTQALQNLCMLTYDENSDVRMYAYRSLGRASIYNAVRAEGKDKLKRDLEAAVAYFEKSSQEQSYDSPAQFCYPFYRTYLAIIFQEAEDEEIQRYLAEAKAAVSGSDSKGELIKAVENLAIALQKSQRLKDRPFKEIAGELNTYSWYCERAAEHMKAAEDKAPGAVKLMRVCNPLLEDRIQTAIVDIQREAKEIYQVTRGSGTEYEVTFSEINKAAGGLSSDNLADVQISSSIIVMHLEESCKRLQEDKKGPLYEVIKEIEHASSLPEKLRYIALVLSCLPPILREGKPNLLDVAILTVLPEEYGAFCNQQPNLNSPTDMGSRPDIYAWQFSSVRCSKYSGAYKIAVGMVGRAGNNQSALAVKEAIDLWRPRYIFFVGIAGGLSDLKKGDVVIADVINGYEYGKLDREFKPRGNWTNETDQGLLNGAIAYALRDDWRKRIRETPPEECKPKVISGEIASGEKVVDDPTNSFFAQILEKFPKVKAVEMEGAGVASAIKQAQSIGIPVGFMVIRSISDLPRREGEGKGTKERDDWKPYASDAAASFTLGWIADGLPLRPSAKGSID